MPVQLGDSSLFFVPRVVRFSLGSKRRANPKGLDSGDDFRLDLGVSHIALGAGNAGNASKQP